MFRRRTAPDHCAGPSLAEWRQHDVLLRTCRWSVVQRVYARVLLALTLCSLACIGYAQDVSVPVDLQIELLGHVLEFERNYSARASEPAHVVIVHKRGDSGAVRSAAQVRSAIERSGHLGRRAASASVYAFDTLEALELACQGVAIVYFVSGFSRTQLESMLRMFAGSGVITVGASGAAVEDGVTLGFELQGGRPRIVVNLSRARAQKLDLSAQLLRLARVVP